MMNINFFCILAPNEIYEKRVSGRLSVVAKHSGAFVCAKAGGSAISLAGIAQYVGGNIDHDLFGESAEVGAAEDAVELAEKSGAGTAIRPEQSLRLFQRLLRQTTAAATATVAATTEAMATTAKTMATATEAARQNAIETKVAL